MSEAAIRASIVTLIEGVSNVGNVYNREPLAATWDAFLDYFKVTISGVDQVRGFTVSCEGIPRSGLVVAGVRNQANQARPGYKIRGYQSLNYKNDTENEFLAIVIDVMDALDGGIVSGSVFNAELAQLDVYQPRMFGGVVCHYAEITQIVMEQL
jgi:hypothetical protein